MNALKDYLDREMLIVGVGNPLRGDDVAGLVLGEKLAARLSLEYLRCEEVPENYLTEMLDSPADTILLVDAVHTRAAAGEIRLLSPDELAGDSISTHNCSMSLLATVLTRIKNKEVLVLGIQPANIAWGEFLTPAVAEAIDRFIDSLPNGSDSATL